ncbi:MAG: Shedu anti-phage system protein SduA domain-containing protein [Chrysiogenia bacterium]
MNKIERILFEILNPENSIKNSQTISPLLFNKRDLQEFAKLLSGEPSEESLQEFIEKHPYYLLGMLSYGEQILSFLTKPRIGPINIADFAIITVNQGGAGIFLFEIEPSSARLFTNKLTPAKTYQQAIKQISDWRKWIEKNKTTFISDILEYTKKLPVWPKISKNGSFNLYHSKKIENDWKAFGGDDFPNFAYYIICSRWAKLNDEERRHLIYINSRQNINSYMTYTYDQIARVSFNRAFSVNESDWE